MKKSLILVLAASVLLAGCSDFLEGDNLKNNLDSKVDYENAEGSLVRFFCDSAQGSVYPNGEKTLKIGYPQELTFTPAQNFAKKYSFSGWQCTDRNTGTDCSGSVEFSGEGKSITVKLLSTKDNLLISPVIDNVPYVVSSYPENDENGVLKNSYLRIVFSKNVDWCGETSLLQENGSLNTKVFSIVYGERFNSDDHYYYYEEKNGDISDQYEGKFDESGKVLTLKAKSVDKFIEQKNVIISILSEAQDAEGCNFVTADNDQKAFSAVYRYSNASDSENPRFKRLEVYGTNGEQTDLLTSSQKDFDFDSEKKFIISLRAVDKQSSEGKELDTNVAYVHYRVGDSVITKTYLVDYTTATMDYTLYQKDFEFETEVKLHITVWVEDKCGNTSDTIEFNVTVPAKQE